MTIRVFAQMEQGSEEWLTARLGMVTASMVGHLISVEPQDASMVDCPTCQAVAFEPCVSVARKAPTAIKTAHDSRKARAAELPPAYKPAQTETARLITAQLVAERINGWADLVFITSDMMRGTLDEPVARDLYSRTWEPVVEVGFITRDDWGFSIGFSPDGLVGEEGLIEVKSRLSKRQVLTIVDDEIPALAMAQMQAGMLVSGRSWCDYISYSGGMKLWVKRVYPDRAWQAGIIGAAQMLENTAAEWIAAYTERTAAMPTTERGFYDQEIEVA
ncbi:MAG: YqaJ viral recombinase family protein [Propionicimonas sp.]